MQVRYKLCKCTNSCDKVITSLTLIHPADLPARLSSQNKNESLNDACYCIVCMCFTRLVVSNVRQICDFRETVSSW